MKNKKWVARFKMTEAKPVTRPLGENKNLTKKSCTSEGALEQIIKKIMAIEALLVF